MNQLRNNLLTRLFSREDGNSATEYAIMLALIVLFCLIAVFSTGEIQQLMWFDTATKVQSIVP